MRLDSSTGKGDSPAVHCRLCGCSWPPHYWRSLSSEISTQSVVGLPPFRRLNPKAWKHPASSAYSRALLEWRCLLANVGRDKARWPTHKVHLRPEVRLLLTSRGGHTLPLLRAATTFAQEYSSNKSRENSTKLRKFCSLISHSHTTMR